MQLINQATGLEYVIDQLGEGDGSSSESELGDGDSGAGTMIRKWGEIIIKNVISRRNLTIGIALTSIFKKSYWEEESVTNSYNAIVSHPEHKSHIKEVNTDEMR